MVKTPTVTALRDHDLIPLLVIDHMSHGLQDLSTEQTFSVGYVFARAMKTHRNTLQKDHVESPQRVERIYQALRKQGLISKMKKLNSRLATREEVTLIHTDEHWNRVEEIESGFGSSFSMNL